MIEKDELYPLIFEPVYKEVMWGGAKFASILKRPLPPTNEPLGEAWEICDRPEVESLVANGSLAGAGIHSLVEQFGKDFVGYSFEGGRFPLLVKIIDASKRLSLQVHPDEYAASRIGGDAQPKTEMWYILQADRGAKIIAGLKGNSTRRQFIDNIGSQDVEKLLQVFDSIPGDAYFINAGRIHAIGAGNLLLEIQQNSDTTYRVSDWGRLDTDGKPRELHIEKALESIDFMDRTVCRITGPSDITEHNRKYPLINKCPFFRVDQLKLVEDWRETTFSTSSFHLITAISSPLIVGRESLMAELPPGSTCLIPACFGGYSVTPKDGKPCTAIKTTL